MLMSVEAKLRNLADGAKWRGHVDGVNREGIISGWAFLGEAPQEDLDLDLFVHGIRIAQTTANLGRKDIDKLLEIEKPANTGFRFDLKTFVPEGALEFLRRFGRTAPDVNFMKDVRIYIAKTQHVLPVGGRNADVFLDISASLSGMVSAAAQHLAQEISAGLKAEQLEPIDLDILLFSNPLFSSQWYEETYEEVAASELDAVEHCREFATSFQYDAGPWFDTPAYLEAAPAAQNSGLPPSVHYALNGHDTWWPGQGRFREIMPETTEQSDYAVLIHLYHLDTVPDLHRFLTSFAEDVDVFISIPEDSPDHDPAQIAELFPRAREILTVPNRGQDVSAFLETVRYVKDRGYKFFCKVHSKKGNKYPDTWRRVMFDALAATPERVMDTVALFRSNPRILMSGPAQFWLNGKDFELGNAPGIQKLTTKLGFGSGTLFSDWAFFAGTCFWIDAKLAEMIAVSVTAEDFFETQVARDRQTAHAMERLFSLVVSLVGGKVALSDGCDWAAPIVLEDKAQSSLRLPAGGQVGPFLVQLLLNPTAVQTVGSTAARPKIAHPDDIFGTTDLALHGAIDVMINCWMSKQETLHDGLADLQELFSKNGLTSAFVVAGQDISSFLQGRSCLNVHDEKSILLVPPALTDISGLAEGEPLPEAVALSFLRSECLFLDESMPDGSNLTLAIARINLVSAYWRGILIRHKVKTFLIWGTTAPKSRLFIHLCQELNIEYQIIERGHFPGTLSIDPVGQFGTGARPQLIDQVSPHAAVSNEANARFVEIQRWYDTQQDNTAYARFQKRETKDIEIMRRARRDGRPVILVIGGNDQGGGVTSPDLDPLRVNWFGSSDNAFSIIRRLVSAKFPDALLVLRPHPSQKPQEAEFVLVAREAALDELIENADLCITIGSTSRAICLLKEKPLLTLGLSELNGRQVGEAVIDATHLLVALRRHIWADFANPYPTDANRNFIIELFDHHLIGVDHSVPTRHDMSALARLIAGRHQQMKTGFLHDYSGQEEKISEAMFEDVRDRGKAIVPIDPRAFDTRERPKISVVLPIYGDYEGTRICFDQLVRSQKENGFRVIMVWDRGPDLRLRDLCLEYAEKAGFTYLKNRENVGFSGTVNTGIIHAGRDDIILLNSDTVPCGDWALRLQDAAYAHPKIASVVPFSNNATIYNLPFPGGMKLPDEEPVKWAKDLDDRARRVQPFAVEMPVSHGYCTYVRRSAYDRLGLYDEMKFGIGQSEDNEFSLRARMAGYFCVCPTNIVMAHAGSTSFGTEITKWLMNGRAMLRGEFSHYFEEITHFFKVGDPLDRFRRQIVAYDDESEQAAKVPSSTAPTKQVKERVQ